MDKEQQWLERLRKYIEDNKADRNNKVCTWWLRLEYNNETPTAQINYWLNKSVAKGILGKETSCYYTKYWFLNTLKGEKSNGYH